jgi:hypothetical protein
MTSTTQWANAAERHYGRADYSRNGTPEDVQSSIAESLCGLLAMQLARYADEPHDDFGDDDELPESAKSFGRPMREESDEDLEKSFERGRNNG